MTLKIAQVIPPWYDLPPKGYGGTENVVAHLVDALVARGHEVTVIGAGSNDTNARMLNTYREAQGTRITHAIPELVHAVVADSLIREGGFDLVHDHTMAGPLLAPGRDTPTLVTTHGIVDGERGWMYERLPRTTGLIAISQSQRRTNPILNWQGVVHNAIDASEFTYTPFKEDWVLFLGRAVGDKGLHLAIDAAREAGRHIKIAAKCHEAPERAYFDKEIAPRLGRGVEWLGEVTGADKKHLLSAASCLLMPIQWDEPFGMVFIEALASGTPVVTMRRGAAPEIFNTATGVMVDYVDDLPIALERVASCDPRACRVAAETMFNPQVMARRYERIYLDWLAHSRAGQQR